MNIKNNLTIVIFSCCTLVFSQTIKGRFIEAKNSEIVLKGYNGFVEKELAKTTTDSLGEFVVTYPKDYYGAALLQIQNASGLIVLLNKENFEMQFQNLQDLNSLKFTNSLENDIFAKGIIINHEAEQKLSGLRYLLPLYKNDVLNENWLKKEITNQEQSFEKAIEKLDKNSYAKHYLSYRKFLGDVELNNERYKELQGVKQHEITFKKIDFASDALWNSGLLNEILSSYYKSLELYKDKDSIENKCIEANIVWLSALKNHPIKLQEVAEFCFTMLEKKNLTKASEQIALSMLNKDNCQLTEKQTDLFEQYRKLAIGNTAPNIVFENIEQSTKQKDLKNINSKYKLVAFGASWCPNCQTDYPSLVGKYKKLKEKYDLEVIYISIDTDKKSFEDYYKEMPFMIYYDGKGWKTQAAIDYHIFATPTYILLDNELKIVAKIQSPEILEAWLQANASK